MIEMHKKVIRYKREHGLRYLNKNVNKANVKNATFLQMARISLIDEKLV